MDRRLDAEASSTALERVRSQPLTHHQSVRRPAGQPTCKPELESVISGLFSKRFQGSMKRNVASGLFSRRHQVKQDKGSPRREQDGAVVGLFTKRLQALIATSPTVHPMHGLASVIERDDLAV